MNENFVRFGKHGLAGVLHSPDVKASACVITCHGLYSGKNSEKYVSIGRKFCKEGLAVLRFDFKGCGESGGLFEETSLTSRIEDLESALDLVEEQGYESVGVMGSSLGGTVAVLTTAKDKRVKALVTWATPCILNELFRGEVIKGFETLRQDVGNYNVAKAVKDMHRPVLIVHGSLDELVPLAHAKVLYENATKPKNIQIIEGADHRFTNPLHREKATELTLNWFKRYLK
jgi:esterase/lipase